MIKLRLLFFSLLLALLLAACSASAAPGELPPTSPPAGPTRPLPTLRPAATAVVFELRPSSTPLPSATPIPQNALLSIGYGPDNFPEGMDPLTGMVAGDPALLARRPMAIKISNFPRSVRPQWGLNIADHVFEYYLEDGLTRFIGVFYGQNAERVGPVRSARPFDEHILRMYKAIFAFGYADDRVIDPWLGTDISKFLVVQHDDNCPPLCRIGPQDDYNNLYADTQKLSEYITQRGVENGGQNLNGLRFEPNPPNGGGAAQQAAVRYSSDSYNLWLYDAASGRYQRFQESENRQPGEEAYEPLYDSASGGAQVTAANVIFLMVPSDYYYQSNSTDIYDFYLMGHGTAYAMRDGRTIKIQWERYTQEQLLSLSYPGGRLYPLKPGNTWFIILSEQSIVESEVGGKWSFTFVRP